MPPIRHVVMFQFVETATAPQRLAVTEGLRNLASMIPEIKQIKCGPDSGLAPGGNFDYCATVDFDSLDAFKVYQTHPAHQKVIADSIKPILKGRSAVQFEIEP
ncbi:hypothetical protein T492DRAFT_1010738 [Pavlovales sp. CCMP2436]|nr:hypothetical protein T492DRAFT_1010738 [Pavlovales sp. CCMP2436]